MFTPWVNTPCGSPVPCAEDTMWAGSYSNGLSHDHSVFHHSLTCHSWLQWPFIKHLLNATCSSGFGAWKGKMIASVDLTEHWVPCKTHWQSVQGQKEQISLRGGRKGSSPKTLCSKQNLEVCFPSAVPGSRRAENKQKRWSRLNESHNKVTEIQWHEVTYLLWPEG